MHQTPPPASHDPSTPPWRIGLGYDRHRLAPCAPHGPGRPLVVGGVRIPDAPAAQGQPAESIGPVAHSDGDALMHAITDALLGALALPDIGQAFPDTAEANRGRDSADFLAHAVTQVHQQGWAVANLDAVVVLEVPKLGPHKHAIRQRLAALLRVPIDRVNVKGKTGEGLGPVGQRQAIEAHAVVLLVRGQPCEQPIPEP